jgi:hypothetical protein
MEPAAPTAAYRYSSTVVIAYRQVEDVVVPRGSVGDGQTILLFRFDGHSQ